MTRSPIMWAAALALVVTPLSFGSAQTAFRSSVDGITVQASVRDGRRAVGGLGAADFELRDNGVPQHVTTFVTEQFPVDLTLVLDLSTSVDGPLLQRLEQAVRDTAALLHGDDRIRLVTISQTLREVFGLRGRGQTMPLDDLVAEGATSLYDGLAAVMMRPTEPGRRQLVVAFTDGHDSTSIVDLPAIAAIARLTDVVVDIVGAIVPVRGGRPRPARELLPPLLTELVGPTGGQVLPLAAGDSVSAAFARILEDFRAGYVLQYVPQGVARAGWHEVTVTVKHKANYEVRARRGYRLPR